VPPLWVWGVFNPENIKMHKKSTTWNFIRAVLALFWVRR